MHAAERISARLAPTGTVCAGHEAVLSQLHAHPQVALKRWAQKAHWLLLTLRRSQEALATGALEGKQTESDREWTSPF